MKSKVAISLFLVCLCSLSLYSQNYYWYDGNRIYVETDRTKINVTVERNVDLSALLRGFEAVSEMKQLELTENNTVLYSVRLSSSSMYDYIVNYLKSNEGIISVSPYFGTFPRRSVRARGNRVRVAFAPRHRRRVSFAGRY